MSRDSVAKTYEEVLQRYIDTEGASHIEIQDLSDRTKVFLVKELFNVYFRDQLYGKYRSDDNIILSSGAVDHELYSLPESLKFFIRYALDRDWYGYSDCLGRQQTREAVAHYENAVLGDAVYDASNVCVTMGATAGMASLFDFIAKDRAGQRLGPAICVTPNYPPLAKSLAQHFDIKLVELDFTADEISLDPILDHIEQETPVILLQTVINPIGRKVSEASLSKFIAKVPKDTVVILDECHECFGEKDVNKARAASNVIRVNSLSKGFSAPGIKVGWFMADNTFIDKYYEFASANYGSPASIFYLLLEALAIFEMHIVKGQDLNVDYFAEYDISADELKKLYREYVSEMRDNEMGIISNRQMVVDQLKAAKIEVIDPTHSVNVASHIPGDKNSYGAFLALLRDTRVSFYPGILNLIFSKQLMRISPNIEREKLEESLHKIVEHYD